jgi:hypothetical protein
MAAELQPRPELDPAMIVRIHPDDRPTDPGARRVIRHAVAGPAGGLHPWIAVTGIWPEPEIALLDEDVADWPIQHPIDYCAALRHTSTAEERGRRGPERPDGDMDVEAFKG